MWQKILRFLPRAHERLLDRTEMRALRRDAADSTTSSSLRSRPSSPFGQETLAFNGFLSRRRSGNPETEHINAVMCQLVRDVLPRPGIWQGSPRHRLGRHRRPDLAPRPDPRRRQRQGADGIASMAADDARIAADQDVPETRRQDVRSAWPRDGRTSSDVTHRTGAGAAASTTPRHFGFHELVPTHTVAAFAARFAAVVMVVFT